MLKLTIEDEDEESMVGITDICEVGEIEFLKYNSSSKSLKWNWTYFPLSLFSSLRSIAMSKTNIIIDTSTSVDVIIDLVVSFSFSES